ncbi:hypothetical protein P4O66_015340 [Electrophorus voltai]|uniref:Uncharacterized protein n=1 Tax=Electrophorus voltai TaxID=2609070 RepID=A0AAD8Z0R4_9TELE|nr:hypothetical protein P4O66_015340 [Electrophorus voltai]
MLENLTEDPAHPRGSSPPQRIQPNPRRSSPPQKIQPTPEDPAHPQRIQHTPEDPAHPKRSSRLQKIQQTPACSPFPPISRPPAQAAGHLCQRLCKLRDNDTK